MVEILITMSVHRRFSHSALLDFPLYLQPQNGGQGFGPGIRCRCQHAVPAPPKPGSPFRAKLRLRCSSSSAAQQDPRQDQPATTNLSSKEKTDTLKQESSNVRSFFSASGASYWIAAVRPPRRARPPAVTADRNQPGGRGQDGKGGQRQKKTMGRLQRGCRKSACTAEIGPGW